MVLSRWCKAVVSSILVAAGKLLMHESWLLRGFNQHRAVNYLWVGWTFGVVVSHLAQSLQTLASYLSMYPELSIRITSRLLLPQVGHKYSIIWSYKLLKQTRTVCLAVCVWRCFVVICICRWENNLSNSVSHFFKYLIVLEKLIVRGHPKDPFGIKLKKCWLCVICNMIHQQLWKYSFIPLLLCFIKFR